MLVDEHYRHEISWAFELDLLDFACHNWESRIRSQMIDISSLFLILLLAHISMFSPGRFWGSGSITIENILGGIEACSFPLLPLMFPCPSLSSELCWRLSALEKMAFLVLSTICKAHFLTALLRKDQLCIWLFQSAQGCY